MIIGIPKEIKDFEHRVALVPRDVSSLTEKGVSVIVSKGAGDGSGYDDASYEEAGAKMYPSNRDIYHEADAIFKIKEPLESEWPDMKIGQMLFAYLQAHTREALTHFMLNHKITAFAYEDIEADHQRPLMLPMSSLAGRTAVIMALYHSLYPYGGNGFIPMPGLKERAPKSLVFGAGGAGRMVIDACEAFGFDVTVMIPEVEECRDLMDRGIKCVQVSQADIEALLPEVTLIFNCVRYTPGLRLISKEMLTRVNRAALIVDIDAEPNGAIETSKASSFEAPVYEVDGIRHMTIDNLPAGFPATASQMMSKALVPYIEAIASYGIQALSREPSLMKGLNVHQGQIFSKKIADAYHKDMAGYEDVFRLSENG